MCSLCYRVRLSELQEQHMKLQFQIAAGLEDPGET